MHVESAEMKVQQTGRIVDVVGHTNIDDFFNHPSAHELTTASERRVEQIMTDLTRRTTEELRNWSRTSHDGETSEHRGYEASLSRKIEDSKSSSVTDTVRTLVPLPSSELLPYPLSADSNSPAALSADSEVDAPRKLPRKIHDRATTLSLPSVLLRAVTRRSEPTRMVKEQCGRADRRDSSSSRTVATHRARFLSSVAREASASVHKYLETPAEDL